MTAATPSGCRYCKRPLPASTGRQRVICRRKACRKKYLREAQARHRQGQSAASSLQQVVRRVQDAASGTWTEHLICGHTLQVTAYSARVNRGRRVCPACQVGTAFKAGVLKGLSQ